MLKSFTRGFSKFFTTERVTILVVFLILAWGLWSYSGSKSLKMDSMATGSAQVAESIPSVPASVAPASSITSGYSMQSTTNPSDLLPQDQIKLSSINKIFMGEIHFLLNVCTFYLLWSLPNLSQFKRKVK